MSNVQRFACLLGCFCVWAAGATSEARAADAVISLKAREVNGAPVGMVSKVTVSPGDVILAEVRLSGWFPDELTGYSLKLEWDSYTSSGSGCGSLYPVGVDNPRPDIGCNNHVDCPEGMICWKPDGNTPAYCTGPNHDPATKGVYFDHDDWGNVCWRSDFAFAVALGQPCEDFRAVDIVPLDYRAASGLWDPFRGFPDDGFDKYGLTVQLQVSDDAKGTFTIAFVSGGGATGMLGENAIDIPVKIENLTVNVDVSCDEPCWPVGSYPDHCGIDAAQDKEPGVLGQQGRRSMVMQFNDECDIELARFEPVDFAVSAVPAGSVNSVFSVVPGPGPKDVTLNFVRRIILRTWTCANYVRALPSGAPPETQTKYCIGFLPSDVNNDEVSNFADANAMLDCLASPGTCAAYQCDLDRSGACAPADILRTIDLFNGGSTLAVWMGQTMDATCPTP